MCQNNSSKALRRGSRSIKKPRETSSEAIIAGDEGDRFQGRELRVEKKRQLSRKFAVREVQNDIAVVVVRDDQEVGWNDAANVG